MGGDGGRRLNSIYSSVVFREEREIEFMGGMHWAGKRVSTGARQASWEGRWAWTGRPPNPYCLTCICPRDPEMMPGAASPLPGPGVAQLVGPSRAGVCVAWTPSHTHSRKKLEHFCGSLEDSCLDAGTSLVASGSLQGSQPPVPVVLPFCSSVLCVWCARPWKAHTPGHHGGLPLTVSLLSPFWFAEWGHQEQSGPKRPLPKPASR